MKRFISRIVIGGALIGFCVTTGAADDTTVVASSYSDRYHLPGCKIVSKIYPDEKVVFQSPEEAEKAGYGPCKKCHPLTVQGNFNKES